MNIMHHKLPLCLVGFMAVLAISPAASAKNASVYYAEGLRFYQQGDIEQAKKQFSAALQEDSGFKPAKDLLLRISQQQGQTALEAQVGGTDRKMLDGLVIPVEFNNTSLSTALEFIRQRAEEATGGRAKLNFVLALPPDLAAKRINLTLNKVPVMETLRYIGGLTGVSFQPQTYAIVVTPAVTAPVPALNNDNAAQPSAVAN